MSDIDLFKPTDLSKDAITRAFDVLKDSFKTKPWLHSNPDPTDRIRAAIELKADQDAKAIEAASR